MAIITTTLPAFKKLAKGLVFESQERVITTSSGLIIQAFKIRPDKIFNDALPLRAFGYPGINTVDCKLQLDDAQDLIDHIVNLLDSDELQLLREKLKE
jgi:hypothetical protein